MEAAIVRLPVRDAADLLCGANCEASCDCGVAYVPASDCAAAAIAANPAKSDRVIAADIGVNPETVRRARKKSTAADAAVAKRTGKDGNHCHHRLRVERSTVVLT
jgi:hypothetical protein